MEVLPAPAEQESRLFGRTGSRIARALRDLRGVTLGRMGGSLRPDLPEEDIARLRQQIDSCLEARGGEVAARNQATEIGRTYLSLSDKGRKRFLLLLADSYGVDHAAVRQAAKPLFDQKSEDALAAAERRLRQLLESPRIRLLRQFNGIAQGVKFLVDLRADILRFKRDAPRLGPLDQELRELLTSWFDAGFLELHAIDWEAPAALLEKLIAYEAVHEIKSWNDLKNRLDSDRRCYGFFHPAMPNEPLIFVEVALVSGIAGNVQELLDETAPAAVPEEADTAIFYSISNAQKGLAGVGFGEFLIKRVVNDLKAKFPRLKAFATLSPMPGFAAWLDDALKSGDIAVMLPAADALALKAKSGAQSSEAALIGLLETPDWWLDTEITGLLQPVLTRLGARYLLEARRDSGTARDPVAHFHLTNGARVERLNFLGDLSKNGFRQSHGMMVNYLYKLGDIEKNHERYTDGHIPASGSVRELI